MGYVTAFRGRRDSYQVPLALAECGKLDCFITDYYHSGLPEDVLSHLPPSRLAESLRGRRAEGLSEELVTQLRWTAAAEGAARILKVPPAAIYENFDRSYGKAAAREARRQKSDLLMYSSYASDAFNAQFSHTPRKVLFQYHPHLELESSILETDRRFCEKSDIVFGYKLESLDRQNGSRERSDSAWKVADATICASSFTKDSLVHAGADPKSITVVPYGVDLPQSSPNESRELGNGFHALFVGSGLQRKGLHHLLLAWQRAQLGTGARLTIVSRVVDPGLNSLLQSTRGVRLKRGVTTKELHQLYREATVFVMPSLVEGFGQVYLEALAHGLPVIGTRHTCLPDLGDEAHGIFLADPGNVEELVALLERLSVELPGNTVIRDSAANRAKQFTWTAFRTKLIATL
jgi:glycosyltransferase involved in cell wall biosynthesis